MIIKDGDQRHGELIEKIKALEQKLDKIEKGGTSEVLPYLRDISVPNTFQNS